MINKITYEFVKESFEKEGYILLSGEYINNTTKLEYICPKGHRHSISWSNWGTGYRCLYCAGHGKPTIAEIRIAFEKENYTLLSKEYIKSAKKLRYVCSKGHEYNTSWDNWKSGKRCPYCAGVAKPSLEEVKNSFEKEGYTLLTNIYVNSRTKLNYICPQGHKHNISWACWNRGHRCQICTFAGNSGPNSHYWKGGVVKRALPLYDTFVDQLSFAEEVRPHFDDSGRKLLEVRCSKCNKFFIPSRGEVRHRINSLNGNGTGECRFYCSQFCKDNCEVYRKKAIDYLDLSPKQQELPYTQEELSTWSQEVLKRANHLCEICGEPAEHAHHIQPKKLEPGLALDPDNGLALCKACHYEKGHNNECSTGNLAIKVCN